MSDRTALAHILDDTTHGRLIESFAVLSSHGRLHGLLRVLCGYVVEFIVAEARVALDSRRLLDGDGEKGRGEESCFAGEEHFGLDCLVVVALLVIAV